MIPQPLYKLVWNGRDVTKDMAPYISSLSYTDNVEAESDTLDVELDDRDAHYRNKWYPSKGDKIELFMGFGTKMDPFGTFQIDRIDTGISKSSGSTVRIKALSAIISVAVRTKRSARYENITLQDLAKTIAANARMTVSGLFEKIVLDVSQHEETDLSFLSRVASEYGYVFNVKNTTLVFTHKQILQDSKPARVMFVDDFSDISISDSTDLTFKAVRHKYFDPRSQKVIQFDKTGSEQKYTRNDISVRTSYVKNQKQAELKAKAKWLEAENGTVTGRLSLSASITGMLAGQNIELRGIGVMSGIYHISSSTHTVSKSGGATVNMDVFRVREISSEYY